MRYRVTRTYADNCDILKEFDNVQDAADCYVEAVRDNKNVARIKIEEIE